MLRKRRIRELRPAALAHRQSESERNRVQPDAGNLAAAPLYGRDERFPDLAIGVEPAAIVVRPRLIEVADLRLAAEADRLVRVRWKPEERLVLEDEIADAVEDRLPLVDLDAAHDVRTVADDDVRAGVDHRVREGNQKVCGLGSIFSAFVGVNADDGGIGHASRAAHDAHHAFDVRLVRLGARAGLIAADEAAAEQRQRIAVRSSLRADVARETA